MILRIKTDFLNQLTKKSKIMFLSEKEIFDTRFDTKKYFVTMRSRFSLRSEKNKDGKSLLYLDISDKFTRPVVVWLKIRKNDIVYWHKVAFQ